MSTTFEPDTQSESVARLLPSRREEWAVPSADATLSRTEILSRFARIKQANLSVVGATGPEAEEITEEYEQSVAFVHNAFNEFEAGEISSDVYDWAFVVPVRSEEKQGNRYAPEVTDFLPILDPRRGVGAMALQRTVAHLAPVKIETYQGTHDTNGMIVFAPAYFDPRMRTDRIFAAREGLPAARQRINEAARLVRQRYGVGLVGLGAVLPGVTQMGKSIKEPGLVTTTGHGGTVHLISETVRYAASKQENTPKVGILGLGSIGASTLSILQSGEIANDIQSFELYDIREELVLKNLNATEGARINPAESVLQLLESSDIIVTAVTDTIDLDEIERRESKQIDLNGKVIIDDSQPGCFQRNQVEARGGKLVWVTGTDSSSDHFLHRVGGYHYGNESGLYGANSSWGCEAEVGSLAILNRRELAISSNVTPEIVRRIGSVCIEAGIRVTNPLQSYGRPVEF